MAGDPTLDEVMSSEIKQDIAQRYFGFRKLIEEDKLDLDEKIRQYSFILEKRISFDLIRIYVLLREDHLIRAFLSLIDLRESLFYDPYLAESENIARRVLACQEFRGWTQGRQIPPFYSRLLREADFSCCGLSQQSGGAGAANRGLFRRKSGNSTARTTSARSSISSVPLAIRRLPAICRAGWRPVWRRGWPSKLRIKPPLPIEQVLLVLPPLKPLGEIRVELKKLIARPIKGNPLGSWTSFRRRHPPCERREEDKMKN